MNSSEAAAAAAAAVSADPANESGSADFPPDYCLVQHLIYHTYTEEWARSRRLCHVTLDIGYGD